MRTKLSQAGFTVVEVVLVIIVLTGLVGSGYYVWHKHNHKSPTATISQTSNYQSPAVTTQSAPQVKNASDLNSAIQVLNQTNITSSNTDSSQLSTEASGF